MNALIPTIIGAYQAGQDNRTQRQRRNALQGYDGTPGSLRDVSTNLIRSGDMSGAGDLMSVGQGVNALRGVVASSDRARQGDYRGASQAAAGEGQVDLARQFMALDQGQLEAAQQRGRQGASALLAALSLPPEQRASYMTQYLPLAEEMGIGRARFEQIDWSNDAMIRAQASTWLDASKLAGDISVQRFGDEAVTMRVSPAGSEVVGRLPIPESRQERFARDQFAYRQEQDQADRDYRVQRDREEDALRREQREAMSRSDVEGAVLAKATREGLESLNPAERQIYDRATALPNASPWGGVPGLPAATPPGISRPAPQAAQQPQRGQQAGGNGASPDAPARPQTQQDLDRLPSGAYYVDPGDGQLYQKEG